MYDFTIKNKKAQTNGLICATNDVMGGGFYLIFNPNPTDKVLYFWIV
jgi:hypothetical protein